MSWISNGFYARWHLNLLPYAAKTVVVITLLFDPPRERLLNLAEQLLFFKTRKEWWEGDVFGWHFPVHWFTSRALEGDEILAAVLEAIALDNGGIALLSEQLRFNQLDEFGPLSKIKARVSQFYP